MAVGPIRGGVRPPVAPVQEKPQGADAKPSKVLEKALDGVLKPGQHMVMPARTGLANFADHFDARIQPDYAKLLKGEAAQGKEETREATPEARADDPQATSMAAESALSMMDLLPPVVVPQGAMGVRETLIEHLEEEEEAEEYRQRQRHQTEPELEQEEQPSRKVELQGGLFTLEEGSVDVSSRRLCTLEAFLDGDVSFVSCAVDFAAIPQGSVLRIPSLDAALGRAVPLRAVHTNERTEGVGAAYLEVCVSEATEELRGLLMRIIAVEIAEPKA